MAAAASAAATEDGSDPAETGETPDPQTADLATTEPTEEAEV